jgi:hypothetical protein
MEITQIYLVENCYGDPNKVYIGKTKNNRFNNHRIVFGKSIIYTIIDNIDSLNREYWEPLETYWIQQFRAWGFETLNKNTGGGGPITHSLKTKLRMSQVNKGKLKPGSGPKNFTEEHLNKIKLAAKKKDKGFYNNEKWIQSQCKIIIQYGLENNFIQEWISIKQASIILNINRFSISQCLSLTNKQKTAGGFVWKYKEN